MSVFVRPPAPAGQAAGRIGCYGALPGRSNTAARWRAGVRRASRQPATAARRSAGRNGFCRLEIAPSLVAMVRKSGPVSASEAIGSSGDDDDRKLRVLLANHPHGFKSVHSRHEDVEEQQIEISGPAQGQALSPVTGGDHAMVGALQQQADGHLDRHIVIHDQYSCQSESSPGCAGIKSTAGCESCRILMSRQLLPRQERSGLAVKKPVQNAAIRMLQGRQIRRGLRRRT